MASSSGNSSGSSQYQFPAPQNSGSEEELQLLMDQRKRKRKESNRESARRSRLRKQKHVEDLTAQVAQLRGENGRILTDVNVVAQQLLKVDSENSILRAQLMELTQRLQSLNDMIGCMSVNDGGSLLDFDDHKMFPDSLSNSSWNQIYLNQPIMADMIYY